MDEHHVGIAAFPDLDRSAGANSDDVDLNAGLFLEDRQQIIEEP